MVELTRIDKFINKRLCFKSKKDYVWLSHRQHIICFFILKVLMRIRDGEFKYDNINRSNLFVLVKEEYVNDAQDNPTTYNKLPLTTLAFGSMLWRLWALSFLRIRHLAGQSQVSRGVRPFFQIRISKSGIELYEAWLNKLMTKEV